MKRLAIIGSGDLGQLIAFHASHTYEVVGFFNDYKTTNDTVNGFQILGKVSDIREIYKNDVFDELIIGIGYKHFAVRKALFNDFNKDIPFANVIHPSAYIDKSCSLGKGLVILPGCTLDRNVTLHDNVLLNTGCIIAHDSEVKKHSFLSPGVTIAGFVSVGECCNIGIGTVIIDSIIIENNIQTGGGTVVINNLSKNGLYVGNPSRFIR
ncbi:MAG: NeuD/PglB/VioB family sugar acetyltransferase [Bacteroidota bacterium]